MTKTIFVYGHLLQSHGRRHGYEKLSDRPGIRMQQKIIDDWVARNFETPDLTISRRWCFDYARNILGRESLPNLHSLIRASKEKGIPCLIAFADLSRVFSKMSVALGEEFLKEIMSLNGKVQDIRQNQTLSNTNDDYRIYLILHGKRDKTSLSPESHAHNSRPGAEHLAADLRRAARKSAKVRGALADDKARQLVELKTELRETSDNPSYAAIARAANERGLRTTRGKPWTGKAVSRALERQTDVMPV